MGEPEVKGGQVVKFEAPKPRFMDRFRAHTPPENVPVKTRARVRGLVGAPLVFLNDVCRLTEGRATLVVALLIYRRTCICRDRTVTLPGAELTAAGITGEGKGEALAKLATAGIIRLEGVGARQTAKVTLLGQAG